MLIDVAIGYIYICSWYVHVVTCFLYPLALDIAPIRKLKKGMNICACTCATPYMIFFFYVSVINSLLRGGEGDVSDPRIPLEIKKSLVYNV